MPETKFIQYVPKSKIKDKTKLPTVSRRLDASAERQKYLKVLRGSGHSQSPVSDTSTSDAQSAISQQSRERLSQPGEQKRCYEEFYVQALPDPRALLPSGGLDPFDVFCVQNEPATAHRMLNHVITYQWSAFAPSQAIVSLLQNRQGVIGAAMNSPVCYYTLVFSGATHNAFYQYRGPTNDSDALFRLNYKTKAIRALRETIECSDGNVTDEILLCIILLASQANGEKRSPPEHRDASPLSMAQDAQYYATNEWEWSHMMALRRLITQRGGLHTIKIFGLAFAIASFDTHTALMLLTKPYFPALMPSASVMTTWSESLDSSTIVFHSRLISSFGFLAHNRLQEAKELRSVLHNMRDLMVGLYRWQNGYKNAPDIQQIIWARNLNQHELLCLPDLSDKFDKPSAGAKGQLQDETARQEDLGIYELCRLGTLAFQFLVLLPYLHTSQTPDRLAEIMIRCLKHCTDVISSDKKEVYHDLLLWATILGTWLSNRTDLRLWFVRYLAGLIQSGRVESSGATAWEWETVRIRMSRFVWLDSQCDEPCREIWDEACQVEVPDDQWSCIVL